MILMALDHSRCFFSKSQLFFDPLDLAFTTPALFFTRWITNLCAPCFFLLAGSGAYISHARGAPLGRLSFILATRGIWLIILGFTVNKFFWGFSYDVTSFTAGIFWCLGCAMIFLSGMIFLPWPVILSISLLIITLHNCFDSVTPENFGMFSWAWAIIHQKGPIPIGDFTLFVLYPIVPWIGVMAAGYSLGKVLLQEQQKRKKTLYFCGIFMVLAFIVLRGFNVYGNPGDWTVQKNALFTFMDILDCEKYPASLSYLLITLSPVFFLLAALDRQLGAWSKPLIQIGAVPFLFYVFHIPVLNLMEKSVSFYFTGADWLVTAPMQRMAPPDFKWDLPLTYGGCILVLMLLYPLCRMFSRFKAGRKNWWLSYL